MFKDTDTFNVSGITPPRDKTPNSTTNALMNRYLDRLALTPAQRHWMEKEIARVPMDTSGVPAFYALQTALGSLADGDELHARLTLALPATRHAEQPAVWLRHQQAPTIHRASMASRPFVRTPGRALRDGLHSAKELAVTMNGGMVSTLKQARHLFARTGIALAAVVLGSLTTPSMAHIHEDLSPMNNRYEAHMPTHSHQSLGREKTAITHSETD
jgi:hypothetical protein